MAGTVSVPGISPLIFSTLSLASWLQPLSLILPGVIRPIFSPAIVVPPLAGAAGLAAGVVASFAGSCWAQPAKSSPRVSVAQKRRREENIGYSNNYVLAQDTLTTPEGQEFPERQLLLA